MKKTINVWQYSTACALGGLIGIFVSRQFSNDWLWTSVGLIIGLFAGWMVAMFADNPKGFVGAIKNILSSQVTPGVSTENVTDTVGGLLVFLTVLLFAANMGPTTESGHNVPLSILAMPILMSILFCIAILFFTWLQGKNLFIRLFLYFQENAGLAILTNVALALGVGHYHGYVAGVAVGFISGAIGAVIYNKGQDSLRAIVAKSS